MNGPLNTNISSLGQAYKTTYASLCSWRGLPLPWHFQWLSHYYLYRDLRTYLPRMSGKVLDLGCGAKPYARLLRHATQHIGIDTKAGPHVDHVVSPNQPLPLDDGSIDAIMSTQVLEHVSDEEYFLSEVRRVARPGAMVLMSVPFLYNEHGAPHDYRRITRHSAPKLFPDATVEAVRAQGGIGSTLTQLLLNWIDTSLNTNRPLRVLKGLLLPLWLPTAFLCNMLGLAADRLDKTEAFYSNLLLCYRFPKRET